MAQLDLTNVKKEAQLFVVQVSMSSPYFTERTVNDEAENSKKMFYKFPKDKRNLIQAARQEVNVARDSGCARFYGLYIANELGKEQLTTLIVESNHKMNAIDPTLHAKVTFMPLSMSGLASGNLLDEMVQQIKDQVHGTVLERIKLVIERNGENGTLPMKTRNSLEKMLDRVQAINVLDDPDVNARIAHMREQIVNDQIIPLRNEIMAILKEEDDRFSSVEVVSEYTDDDDEPTSRATKEGDLPMSDSGRSAAASSQIADRIDVRDMDD